VLQLQLPVLQKIGVKPTKPFLDGETAREARKGPTEGVMEGDEVVEAADDGPGLPP